MSRDVGLVGRRTGRRLALAIAVVALGTAAVGGWRARMPELRVYDGLWMLLWATVTVGLTGALVWHWPRERSLPIIAAAASAGCWLPIVISASTHRMPLTARLRGAWLLGGADVVGITVPIGFVCLWLALREHRPTAVDSSP